MQKNQFRVYLQNEQGSILDVTGHITDMLLHTDVEGSVQIEITIKGFSVNEFNNKEQTCLPNSKLMIGSR